MKLADTRRQQGQWEQEHDLSERRTSAYEKQAEGGPTEQRWYPRSMEEALRYEKAKQAPEKPPKPDESVLMGFPDTPEGRRKHAAWKAGIGRAPSRGEDMTSSYTSVAADLVSHYQKEIDTTLANYIKTPDNPTPDVDGLQQKRNRAAKLRFLAKSKKLTDANVRELESLATEAWGNEPQAATATGDKPGKHGISAGDWAIYEQLKREDPTLTEEKFAAALWKEKAKKFFTR